MSEIKTLEDMRNTVKTIAADCDEGWILGCLDAIEAEIAEKYMEQPVDADGVPIRCGDVVDGGMGDSGKVQHVELWPDGFVVVYECHPGTFTRYAPDAVRHVKPRTLEDVLCDLEGMRGNYADYEDVVCRAAKYAAEIRELLRSNAE